MIIRDSPVKGAHFFNSILPSLLLLLCVLLLPSGISVSK